MQITDRVMMVKGIKFIAGKQWFLELMLENEIR